MSQVTAAVSTRMVRRGSDQPTTPAAAAATGYTGTLFGFEWDKGVPHENVLDTMSEAYASGGHHTYVLVEVSVARVVEVHDAEVAADFVGSKVRIAIPLGIK